MADADDDDQDIWQEEYEAMKGIAKATRKEIEARIEGSSGWASFLENAQTIGPFVPIVAASITKCAKHPPGVIVGWIAAAAIALLFVSGSMALFLKQCRESRKEGSYARRVAALKDNAGELKSVITSETAEAKKLKRKLDRLVAFIDEFPEAAGPTTSQIVVRTVFFAALSMLMFLGILAASYSARFPIQKGIASTEIGILLSVLN